MSTFYKMWLALTSLVTIIALYKFWPVYQDTALPLFTDITTLLVFSPSYFILMYGVILHLAFRFTQGQVRVILFVTLTLLFFVIFVYQVQGTFMFRIIVAACGGAIGMFYFILTTFLIFKKVERINTR